MYNCKKLFNSSNLCTACFFNNTGNGGKYRKKFSKTKSN